MQAIDQTLLTAAVNAGQNLPVLSFVARWLTELGGWLWLIPLTIVAAAMLALRDHGRRAAAFLIVTLSGRAVVELLKWLTDRPRPDLIPHMVTVHSLSFPSGHAANSMLVYLSLALIAAPLLPRLHRPAVIAVGLSVAVGLTRPILGVHWPSDVLAGWALGIAWTLSLVWMLDKWVEGQPPSRPSVP